MKIYAATLAILSIAHGLCAMELAKQKTANELAYEAVEDVKNIDLQKFAKAIDDKNFNVNAITPCGYPLARLLLNDAEKNQKNALEAFELLLTKQNFNPKLDATTESNAGFNLLQAAALGNNILPLQKILENRKNIILDINKFWTRDTALNLALSMDKFACAELLLLQEGINPNIGKNPAGIPFTNENGLNPIDLAIKLNKSNELLQALYEETNRALLSLQNDERK